MRSVRAEGALGASDIQMRGWGRRQQVERACGRGSGI